VLPACEELGIGFVPYSPLGRGYLTGKLMETATFGENDNRVNLPRFTPEALKSNRLVIDLLEGMGRQKGATPARIALAWLLAQKPWIGSIPGTTKLLRLEENIASLRVELTSEDLTYIDTGFSALTILGDRYPKDATEQTGR
jgi:aryl-alcohol dehydrogenase-like predicted oxidoreductase